MSKKRHRGENAFKFTNDWNLDWFSPSEKQAEALEKIEESVFNIIDASSGCGKTTLALWYAFTKYRQRAYSKIVFIKSPTEIGDDQIGFLPNGLTDKLGAHYQTTREIMANFVSKNKLACDESNGNIVLSIPNFLLGTTWDNAIVLIDETQVMSKSTVKMLLERCGTNTKYIVIGDSKQRYAVKHRGDGFSDLIVRTTNPIQDSRDRTPKNTKMTSYTKMTSKHNMRSEGSAYITEIYDEEA
jgi:predicted ribonuclease YlaK